MSGKLYDTDNVTVAIGTAFISQQDGETVNMVDGLFAIAQAIEHLAYAVAKAEDA